MTVTKYWKLYDILYIVLLQFFIVEKDGRSKTIASGKS